MAHRGALLYSPRRGQGAATMTRERSSSSSRMGVGVGVGISDTEPLSLSTPSTAAYDESSSGAVHTREYQVYHGSAWWSILAVSLFLRNGVLCWYVSDTVRGSRYECDSENCSDLLSIPEYCCSAVVQ